MKDLPKHVEQKFYKVILGKISLNEFEIWLYTNNEIESILGEAEYMDLISFNFKKEGARFELKELLSDKYIDLGELEKRKMLDLLQTALKRDERLPDILKTFYDLYCKGYDFLQELGLGYGLAVVVPPQHFKAETWEKLMLKEKKQLLDSFYPQLETELKKTIYWIEQEMITFTGKTDENGFYIYKDLLS